MTSSTMNDNQQQNKVSESDLIKLLKSLDERAREFDGLEYGLPLPTYNEQFTKIIRDWMEQLPFFNQTGDEVVLPTDEDDEKLIDGLMQVVKNAGEYDRPSLTQVRIFKLIFQYKCKIKVIKSESKEKNQMPSQISREGFAKIFYDSKYDVEPKLINECYHYATHSPYTGINKEDLLSWIDEWLTPFQRYRKEQSTLFAFIKSLKEKIISMP